MDFFQMPPRCLYKGPRGESSKMCNFFEELGRELGCGEKAGERSDAGFCIVGLLSG
jgi:hypothetical protein